MMLELSKGEPIDMDVALQGRTQLRLQITAGDPDLAALIANAWAEIVLKGMLGTWDHSRQVLETEVQNTKEAWVNAQSALEDYISLSQVEVITMKLSTAKNNLQNSMNKIGQNQLLISDALAFLAQIEDFNAGDPLSTGSALSIVALQQRATGAISGTQFQLQGEELLGQGFTAAVGRENILNLISALEDQNVEIEAELPDLEISISSLSVFLESEKSKVEIFTQERDLYRTSYQELTTQLEKTKVTQVQEGKSALISAYAVVPRGKGGPNTIIITALAGMAGLMIVVGSVFFVEWWNKEEEPV